MSILRGRLLARTMLAGVSALGAPMAVLGGAALFAPAAVAQETSVIFDGRVVSNTGAAVPSSTVTVTSIDQGFSRTATSDANGRFQVAGLPIGSYRVSITAAGYPTLVDNSVPLRVGASSFTYTMTPAAGASATAETIVVTGQRVANLDFNRTTRGVVIDVTELSEQIPLGRSVAALALLAPGSAEGDTSFGYGSQPSISGASIAENAYVVNGLNVTNHRTLIGGSRIPFEFYDSVEVRTGGYQAEFGRATGGVINAITKSGSNDFHAGVITSLSLEDMYEQAPDTYTQRNQLDERFTHSTTLYASGPIIKDKLFYYALYEARNIEASDTNKAGPLVGGLPTGIRFEEENDSPFMAAKIDWNIFDGHRLEATYIDIQDESAITKSLVYQSDNSLVQRRGTYIDADNSKNAILKYTGEITDWFTISAMYGKNENWDIIQPANATVVPITDTITNPGVTAEIGPAWSVTDLNRNYDSRDAFRIDADFNFTMLGDHHVKVGLDNEKLESKQRQERAGSIPVTGVGTTHPLYGQTVSAIWQRYSAAGACATYTFNCWRINYYRNNGGFESDQKAYYIQDSWDVLPNLTLQLGVRYDEFENQNILGETFIHMKDQYAPRIGFAWDPLDDGLTKIFGNFGRYNLPVATNTNIRLGGAETYYRVNYGVNQLDANGYPVNPTYRSLTTLASGNTPNGLQAVATDIEPFYEDEYTFGAERTFGDWTLGLSYTHRELKQVIEDIAIDAAVNAYCLAQSNGATDCSSSGSYSGFHQYVLANPGSDVTVQLLNPILGDPAGTLRTLNLSAADLRYPKAERKYDAVEFTFARPFDGKWGLQGSYVWANSEGNYEGAVKSDVGQDDAGLTQDFDQPGLVDGSYGKLPNHREHSLKVWGTYSPIENLLLGANMRIQSPRQFGCLGQHPTDDYAVQYGAASWYCQGQPTPRGEALESDWTQLFDASIAYNFMAGPLDMQVRLDIFNLFNEANVLDINEFGELSTGAYPADPNPNYGLPTAYTAPRQFRVGFSARF